MSPGRVSLGVLQRGVTSFKRCLSKKVVQQGEAFI